MQTMQLVLAAVMVIQRPAAPPSPQLEALSGVAMEQWYDGTDGWTERVHPDDRDREFAAYRKAAGTG